MACRHVRQLAFAAAAVLTCAPWARADFPSYNLEPYVYTLNPTRFADLVTTAQTQTVRIAVIGDSQETNPGGLGLWYMPSLNYQAATHYGNSPETPFASFVSTDSDSAQWTITGARPAGSGQSSPLAPSQLLPNQTAASVVALNNGTNIYNESYGPLVELQPDAAGVSSSLAIPAQNYFKTDGVVDAQIFAATATTSGGITYAAKPQNSPTTNYFVPITTSGTLNPGLASATYQVISAPTAALDFAGQSRMQLEISGTDPNVPTDILGVRFCNETHPEGMVFSSFSAGGSTASDFLNNTTGAGPMYAALGMDAAMLTFGANDAESGADFEADEKAVIATLRAWTGDPNYRVILVADPARTGLTADQSTAFDQYVGEQMDIAAQDPNVMVINVRRMMDAIGWNVNDPEFDQYTIDGVHPSATGAQLLASAEFQSLLNVANVPEPASLALLALGSTTLLRRRARRSPN